MSQEQALYPYFDELLKPIDEALGFSRLSVSIYLIIVFMLFFGIAVAALRFKKSYVGAKDRGESMCFRLFYVLAFLLLIVGMITSYNAFHYSLVLIIGIFSSLAVLALSRDCENTWLQLLLAILIFFAINFRLLANNMEEGETTSDMINIYLNGFFRWSIHGGHYDLAPLDAVSKVVLSYVAGGNIYNPILGTIIYVLHGLVAFLLLYSILKLYSTKLKLAIPLIVLTMLSYPYSPALGLTVPPAPLSHMMGVMVCAFLLSHLAMGRRVSVGSYVVVMPLLIYAILVHPTSLGLLLVLTIIVITLLTSRRYIHGADTHVAMLAIYMLSISLVLYFSKVIYTSFASGFTSTLELLWNYILNAFQEQPFTQLTTRNLGYSALPRLSLTGFAIFLAIVALYALKVLLDTVKKFIHEKRFDPMDLMLLGITSLYGLFTLVAYLTGVGGVSQSRFIYNGIQPYMELALILHAAYKLQRSQPVLSPRRLLIALLIASIATLISPNAMPLNYTIPMAKPATINDHLIAYTYMGLIDKNTFIAFYNSYGDLGRFVAVQERSGFSYGLGSTMAVVYYYIAPRVVDAKNYWDSRIMAVFSMPRNVSDYTVHKVFDAWIYGFYLYVR